MGDANDPNRFSSDHAPGLGLDGWVRRKLRCIVWRQWKKPRTRFRELRRLGLGAEQAKRVTGNCRGPWWNAGQAHTHKGFPQIHRAQTRINIGCVYREFLHQKQGEANTDDVGEALGDLLCVEEQLSVFPSGYSASISCLADTCDGTRHVGESIALGDRP
jgi:hypothetical protein